MGTQIGQELGILQSIDGVQAKKRGVTVLFNRINVAHHHMGQSPLLHHMPLIMDIGMNNAKDTLFYLKKGFRVVSVEANPQLVARARGILADYICSGQLTIESIGLGGQAGSFPFYKNLDNDHWSSFDREWGTRDGTRFEKIEIECITPSALIERYGMPYYLKIDIEGHDLFVIRALADFDTRPRYVSVEEHGASYFGELWAVGCRSFKLVNQNTLWQVSCPNPPLEGVYVEGMFDGETSGPFGNEAPGTWEPFDVSVERYLDEVRSPTRGYRGPPDSWFDIHGRFD